MGLGLGLGLGLGKIRFDMRVVIEGTEGGRRQK